MTCCQLFGWLRGAGPWGAIEEVHQQWLDVGSVLEADDPFVGMQLTDVHQEVVRCVGANQTEERERMIAASAGLLETAEAASCCHHAGGGLPCRQQPRSAR